ncbi:hypothetical protein JTB14_027949 [Gonioctena quinquepunctata]|nr:hypothetical protein JTB14_018867 [Gonioctena quinquepunctata]KAG5861029.1 hypothetical protein JTB14_027949 [Gonioctena quinquepunctata]
MGEVIHQNNSEGVVDIYDYTIDLILEICPTMEASSIVSTAENLIRRATEIFERNETKSLQNGRNEVVANKKKDRRNCLDTIVEEDVFKPWKKNNSKRRLQKYLRRGGQYHGM